MSRPARARRAAIEALDQADAGRVWKLTGRRRRYLAPSIITSSSTTPHVALVTGASSGFGYLIAEALATRGFRVFGTSRSCAPSAPDGVTMLALDVDRDASVIACVDQLIERCGRIDLLVNNAGRAMVGAAEETTAAEARALFETNLFGIMRVTSAVLPAMRARRAGRIINLGSVSGLLASVSQYDVT